LSERLYFLQDAIAERLSTGAEYYIYCGLLGQMCCSRRDINKICSVLEGISEACGCIFYKLKKCAIIIISVVSFCV